MKTTLMIFALLTLASCGQYAEQKDLDNAEKKTREQDNRIGKVETRLADLEGKVSANTTSINNLSASLTSTNNSISLLEQDLAEADQAFAEELQNSIDEATANSNSLLAMIETLQGQTTTLLAKQAALELEDRVVGIYDPCPLVASTGFTESFFQMASGKLVAYFEDGSKRFLSVLKTGTTYRTTDSRACLFTL